MYQNGATFQPEESLLRERVTRNPKDHAAWHALGLSALNADNLPFALQCLEAAIAINSKVALYQRNVCEMYRRAGQLDKAATAGRAAVRLVPADLDAHYNLGLVYTDAHNYDKAVQSYRKALKINPQHGLSWNNLGAALEQLGDKSGALDAYEKAIALNPQHAEAQNNAGAISSELGRLDEARMRFQAAIAARGDFVEAHYNLSSLKTYTKDDPHLALLERVYSERQGLSDHARIRYCFALGKALDDVGDFDRAFAAYDEGNRVQHAILPMDEARADHLLERVMAVFDKAFFEARRDVSAARDSHRTPIFIVGMPRSGTTLLEQILCSHASVHGAGELVELSNAVGRATGTDNGALFTERVAVLSADDLKKIGDDYLNDVWKLSPQSRFITDKMPANFFYLGLIHLALPNAKIIHAMRDPMDSCFSCFSRLFNDTMDFAYDQGTLGRYYVRYMTLMRHWQKVLPQGTVLDMPYEDMVADTETNARRVLEFVGLPWDPNCLNFHENKRIVKTASVAQVRKPIYKSSVARWKHFARHLQPLLELVKYYRPVDDAAALSSPAQVALPDTVQRAHAAHVEGIAHYRADRFDQSLACYDRALALHPDFPEALNSRGFVLQDRGLFQDALECFSRAVELAPEMAMARLNLGMLQLKLGKWKEGWDNYESRWTGSAEAAAGSLNRPACPLPLWDSQAGLDTATKRLLVVTEQGFGDTFHFARYLPLVAQRFAKVGFVCSQPTQRLLEWSIGDRIAVFTRMPMDDLSYEAWDYQCPLMSLPRALGTRPNNVPTDLPTLRASNMAAAHWRERLNLAAPGRLRIGIAWAGRKAHRYDARRSLHFGQIAPLLNDPRVTWVSLQKWAPEDTRPDIPSSVDWLDWTEELMDFADTAALVAELDLVVSIDSAMVHLAGALNKPIWMLDRFDNEWRWLHGREDSPWYPKLRIFRQSVFGEWEPVVQRAGAALALFTAPREIQSPRVRTKAAAPVAEPAMDSATAGHVGPKGLSVAQGMQLASQHQSAGRLAPAESLLLQILQVQSRHAHALHLLGVVAYQSGRTAQALDLIGQAIAIDDSVALFHCNLAEMLRQHGQTAQAIVHGERAVVLDASMASAHSNLGIAYFDAKDLERAQAAHEKALALQPRTLQSLNNMGSIARARNDREAAAEWYHKALAVQPNFVQALTNMGAVLVEQELAEKAVPFLERALELEPSSVEVLCNLGLARFRQNRPEDAAALLERSLQLRTDYPEAMIGLAQVLQEQEQLARAETLLRRVVLNNPSRADAWVKLGTVCLEQDDTAGAQAAYEQALAVEPDSADALTGMGNLNLEWGRIDAATELLERALKVDADNLGARFHLVQARKVSAGEANLAALESCLEKVEKYSADKRISLHYALGKAYDDLKEWDRAFPHFMEGARLKRSTLSYDPMHDSWRGKRIAEILDAGAMQRLHGSGESSDIPVFVLGMPRSGTTLTEQIIASHPDVFGAGELRDLMDIAQTHITKPQLRLTAEAGRPAYPENLAGLDTAVLARWGRDYLLRIRRRAPHARHITDKMPANYLALGLIPLMLPNAKIVHVMRNPVDTCVSCFTRLFNRHQDATYDLRELGQHYAVYARLMQHWRAVLPQGNFMEIQYEDIVADMPTQARRLIDFVGLPWNDACLSFHKTQRNVRTASVAQVRQPIYSTSVERWRHYEKYLGPLFEGMGEFAP